MIRTEGALKKCVPFQVPPPTGSYGGGGGTETIKVCDAAADQFNPLVHIIEKVPLSYNFGDGSVPEGPNFVSFQFPRHDVAPELLQEIIIVPPRYTADGEIEKLVTETAPPGAVPSITSTSTLQVGSTPAPFLQTQLFVPGSYCEFGNGSQIPGQSLGKWLTGGTLLQLAGTTEPASYPITERSTNVSSASETVLSSEAKIIPTVHIRVAGTNIMEKRTGRRKCL